jgi:hypothetical protein
MFVTNPTFVKAVQILSRIEKVNIENRNEDLKTRGRYYFHNTRCVAVTAIVVTQTRNSDPSAGLTPA